MATARERLAASLEVLERLQRDGRRVFHTGELTRVHRERLVANGYLRRVTNGWLISSAPGTAPNDPTPWYSAFREFCARYCERRFGTRWWLSAELSALLHGGNTAIPEQVVVHAPEGGNNRIALPFGTALFDVRDRREPGPGEVLETDGLRLLAPASAAVRVSAAFFRAHPVEAEVLLSAVRDASQVLVPLLDGGRSVVAGRLAGAFRRVGRPEVAEEIVRAMQAAGQVVRETDPFDAGVVSSGLSTLHPAAARLRALWERFREPVREAFPPAPGLSRSAETVLLEVDEIYRTDAYHSLSIEGYRVSPELVERVRSGKWDPEGADRGQRDALAAFGYWGAFRRVRDAVARVLAGEAAAKLARAEHQEWQRELFAPSVTAGILPAHALAGYRTHPVYIRGSRYVPPRADAVVDAMGTLFDLLEGEPEPSVRAVLGHWALGAVHPWPDGNGRMARFLMNLMLCSGGYPWTVIRVEHRAEYMAALDEASSGQRIEPFARFLAARVASGLDDFRFVGAGSGEAAPDGPVSERHDAFLTDAISARFQRR